MPVFKIKKLNDNERQQYKDEVAKIIEDRDKRFDKLFEVYGPNGKLPQGFSLKNEFDSIEVPLPIVEGMSPEDSKKLATAIIIGSIMNPEKISSAVSASTPDADTIFFNQYYLVENIINGGYEREGNYPPIMVQAKQAAADAIRDLNNGDPAAAKKMLNNLIEYGAKNTAITGIHRSDVERTAEKVYLPAISAAKLAFDHIDKKPLNTNGSIDNPVVDIQKKVGQKTLEAVDRVFDLKNRLLSEPSAAGSNERKELVAKLLFEQYLSNLSFVETVNRSNETGEYVDEIAEKIGYGTDHELYGPMGSLRGQLDKNIETALKYNTVSDLQVILSKDDGYEKLKGLYMESIRNSELYHKMVGADGDEIIDVMKFADNHIHKESFYEFTDVITNGEAKAVNEKNKKRLKTALKEAENRFFNTFDDEMNRSGINKIVEGDYGISDFDEASLTRNAEIVGDMFDLIDGVDKKYIRSSKEFREMKKSLVKLNEMAARIVDRGRAMTPGEIKRYSELLKETDELAKTYLENKTDSSSPYAKSRMTAVFELRRRLKANSKKIRGIYTEYRKNQENTIKNNNNELLNEMQNELAERNYYNPVANIKTDPYRQGVYKGKSLGKPALSSYSTDRTATHSIALMKLAAEIDDKGNPKYTIDQLMDPKQLVKEKSSAYDDTADWILDYSNEGHEWIAGNMYNGLKNLSKQIDKYAEKIDFTSADYMNTPEYRKLQQLTFQIFDIEQEMMHCRSEILVIAGKEHPELKNINQLKDMFANLKGPLAAEGGFFMQIKDLGNGVYHDEPEKDHVKFVNSVLARGVIKKVMADAQEKGIPYSKIFGVANQDNSFKMILSLIGMQHMDLYDPEIIKYAGTKLLDGSICKDIKVTFNPDENLNFSERYTVTGIPTLQQLKDDYFYDCTAPDSLTAIMSKNTAIMIKKSRDEKPEKREITNKAIDATRVINDYVTGKLPIREEDKEYIIGNIKDVVAYKSYDVFVKDGLTGETLREALEKSRDNIPEVEALEEGYIGKGDLGALIFEDGAKKFALSAAKATYNVMADEAVTRLNEGNYENRNALLKDAALAMTGKLYNLNGKLPNNPKTKKPYTFTEYAKALAKEPSFTATINKGNGLDDAAKIFARVAGDGTKLREMLAKTNMVGQNLQAQNKNVNKNANKNANIEQGKRK